jgi:molybdate transport system substrate-binding protein
MKTFLRLFSFLCFAGVAYADSAVIISAAASLKDALARVQPIFVQANPGIKLTFNFAGSGVLQQQIEAGAPVDVFISAAPQQMDALEKNKRLLEGTRRNLLTNSLVLIAPKDSALLRDFRDLTKPEVRHIAVGDPKAVPAGAYAAEVFAALDLTAALAPKLVRLLDVRQVLTTVETGDADAGLVYRTDAMISERIRVVATAETRTPIVYPIAVISGSQHSAEARAFAAFLDSEGARKIFAELGFGPPP